MTRLRIPAAALLAAAFTVLPATTTPAHADTIRARQWGLQALHTTEAWRTTKGEGITVAVLDTGVDAEHPDLKGSVLTGRDLIGFGAARGDRAWARHGTAMAGIIAGHGHGPDGGDGVLGIAPGAKILPVRVILEGTDTSRDKARKTRGSALADGIRWAADHGADVINLSLGESGLMARLLKGGILNQAITHANGKGAVVVAAAGNDSTALQPYKLDTPVLVVNAADRNGQPASFTNFGAQNAVSAPGVDILSTLPTYPTKETLKNTSGYGKLSGTSMASPYVSAVAALLHHQGLDPAAIMSTIRGAAANPQQLAKLGLGNVDASAAVKVAPATKS